MTETVRRSPLHLSQGVAGGLCCDFARRGASVSRGGRAPGIGGGGQAPTAAIWIFFGCRCLAVGRTFLLQPEDLPELTEVLDSAAASITAVPVCDARRLHSQNFKEGKWPLQLTNNAIPMVLRYLVNRGSIGTRKGKMFSSNG